MNKDFMYTPRFRLNFPALVEPTTTPYDPDGKRQYRITMMFPKKDNTIDQIRDFLNRIMTDKFGPDVLKSKNLYDPITDGDEYETEEGKQPHAGYWVIRAKTDFVPALATREGKPVDDPADLYSGCWARAGISAYAWDYNRKKGVTVNFNIVQKLGDGQAFGGGAPSHESLMNGLADNPIDDDLEW